jgi:peroxiredoxin
MKSFISIILCLLPFFVAAQTSMPSWEEIEKDKDYLNLQKELQKVEDETSALMAEYGKLTDAQKNDETAMKSFNRRYSEIQSKTNKVFSSFVSGHPDSFISLLALSEGNFDFKELDALYNSLSERIKNTDMGQTIGAEIRLAKHTAIGSKAPDFAQNNDSGKSVKLSEFKGKYVLIDFWASWCGPCRRENPNVVKAYHAFKDKNFTILGVSLDESKTAWLNAVRKDGLTWTQVSDLKGWQNSAAALFGIKSIPQNFLIDPNGVIVEKNLRGETLQQVLSQVIK